MLKEKGKFGHDTIIPWDCGKHKPSNGKEEEKYTGTVFLDTHIQLHKQSSLKGLLFILHVGTQRTIYSLLKRMSLTISLN